jgi:hypothetical protein
MLQHNLKILEEIKKNSTVYRTFLEGHLGPYKWERALACIERSFCSADTSNTSQTKAKLNRTEITIFASKAFYYRPTN